MINLIELVEKKIKEQKNYSRTENGALGYKSSDSALVDLNFKVSSFRNSNEEEIIKAFDEAFYENKKYALKWLFFARDIREGLGERRLFRICYERLFELDNEAFYANLNNIAEYGRWDDLVYLLNTNYISNKAPIFDIIEEQLEKDLNNLQENKPISLLGKWLPSENASSKKTKTLARKVRRGLKLSPRKYRLMLSTLRKHLNVVEVQMCNKDWNDIDYEKVPSLANLRYKDAFLRNDRERRIEYLNGVESGSKKINAAASTPVDIVSKYSYGWYNVKPFDSTLESMWKNLKGISIEDTLVVADGSGSMLSYVGGKTTALDVSVALAIYTSEHNSGVYKNKYITFSSSPEFVKFNEESSLRDKIKGAYKHSDVTNTNIEAVFNLILGVAVENSIPKEEMIKNILIISDMEFDRAQYVPFDGLLFNSISRRFNEAGYDLPKLIFWNVNSRTKTIPLTENKLGVCLVSGFSQNVLKMVMSNNYNPYDILIETLDGERYDRVRV